MLRFAVEFAAGAANLVRALTLLCGGRGGLADDVGYPLHRGDDLDHRADSFGHLAPAAGTVTMTIAMKMAMAACGGWAVCKR